MTGVSHVPRPLEGTPPNVQERLIKEVECPNPECDQLLNITDINVGTKVQCTNCKNVTWVPAFQPKWWQRARVIIGGAILSIIVGAAASLLATAVWEFKVSELADGNTDAASPPAQTDQATPPSDDRKEGD